MSNPTLTAVAALTAAISPLQAPPHQSPAQLVGALHSAFGEHHARAVHAKGVMLVGHFTPTLEARELSKARLFVGPTLPVTVRFSDFTGIPDIPDTVGGANPRGFALKFHVPDGTEVDVVNHSFNGFPTKTSDEFSQLLHAIGASGPGSSKPTALDRFLDSHPIAKTFLTTQLPAPVSYSTLAYFGVNSFKFVNKKGIGTYVRYQFRPDEGEEVLTSDEIQAKGPNYLSEEISARVAKGSIRFTWYAQISGHGDIIDDPSIAWPNSRRQVKLGTITIDRMIHDPEHADKATLFLPGKVPSGIEVADPMVALRNKAYPISFKARQ